MTSTYGSDSSHAVDAARAAASSGRLLEAVDLLSAVPPAARTAESDVEAVALRNRAFDDLDKAPGRPSWPAPIVDPFPAVTAIPEIERPELTADVLGGAIVHHGCLRVNGLFDERRVLQFRELIDRAYDEREELGQHGAVAADPPCFVPFAPGQAKAEWGRHAFVRVVDVPHALSELVDAFTEAGVRDAVGAYFNERPVMIANKWVMRCTMPADSRCPDFHQDGAFLGDAIRTVDCWVALSDCGPGTGAPAIDLVARRLDGVLETGEGSQFPWTVSESTARAVAGDVMVSPVFAPGDALFFDERLLHRTSVGPDVVARYAIESWFVAPSSYPAKHVPVVF